MAASGGAGIRSLANLNESTAMQPVERGKRQGFGGKYRGIILAVGFFLLLDLTALVMNFYVARQITSDAMLINVAGRQRMLSQQMAKALLEAEADVRAQQAPTARLAEVERSALVFAGTLTAFERGGTVTAPDGTTVRIDALEGDFPRELLTEAVRLWKPYRVAIEAAISPGATAEQLQAAVGHSRANNVELLGLMNHLTAELAGAAQERADMLRIIQVGVIVLALANFVFILLNFIRSLRASDAVAEGAREETERILATVNEGLFLLHRDGSIGSQMSAALPTIMGRPIDSGAKFLPLLETMVAPDVFTSARDYIELLFGKRVKEALVKDLNPLQQIEVREADSNKPPRYLTLQFNRVKSGGDVLSLLVTVADVTEQVRLARELEEAKRGARAEIASLLGTLSADRASLARFLGETERVLNEVNEMLQQPAHSDVDLRRRVAGVFRSIHGIKGDAAAMGLGLFESLAHEFEDTLCTLRDKATLAGEDLLSLPPLLDAMLDRVATVRNLLDASGTGPAGATAPVEREDAAASLRRGLESLAARIAGEQRKQVRVRTELDGIEQLPEANARQLREIALQLLRNAIAHGIEPAAERGRVNKPEAGEVYVGLHAAGDGDYELVLRDDGRGIDVEKIRDALRRSGRYSDAEIAQMDKRQLYGKLFESGFSTAATIDEHAGRGVGLDLVAERVRALGGRLKLTSRPNEFTEFSIRFAGQPSLEVA